MTGLDWIIIQWVSSGAPLSPGSDTGGIQIVMVQEEYELIPGTDKFGEYHNES